MVACYCIDIFLRILLYFDMFTVSFWLTPIDNGNKTGYLKNMSSSKYNRCYTVYLLYIRSI